MKRMKRSEFGLCTGLANSIFFKAKIMKFNYKTYPVLEKVETGKLGVVGFYPEDAKEFHYFQPHLKEKWGTFAPFFKQKIQAVSNPFYDAMVKAGPKLGANPELFERIKTQSGTMLMGNYSVCYSILNTEEIFQTVYFIFIKDIIVGFAQEVLKENEPGHKAVWLSKPTFNIHSVHEIEAKHREWQSLILLYLNFIKYAEIEVKHLSPNQKIKNIITQHKNDTKSNIEILDSTWFTTLVKSDAFKVRGHFRLQPCGPGMKDRKLIWINDFEKQGYVRNFKRPINLD